MIIHVLFVSRITDKSRPEDYHIEVSRTVDYNVALMDVIMTGVNE